MTSFRTVNDVSTIALQVETAGLDQLRTLSESFAAASSDIVQSVLEEAAKFSAAHFAPLNAVGDAAGCRLEQERVRTPHGYRAAWAAFVDAGWPTLEQPEAYGGRELPLVVWAGCQELFDRGCVSLGMMSATQRAAARLIASLGDEATKQLWLPRLVSGEWGATICISESDAGSDVGRIRSLATPTADGSWTIDGEKIWISFGDHDLAPRIVHCMLARTPDAPDGGGGLSLFLVPDTVEGPQGEQIRNRIATRRIEEKLGLHGSPTCALGFAGARAQLLGTLHRGLAQMFVMITNMRLSVGVQGLGIAAGAADTALAYAEERRQGGRQHAPSAIIEHADVQRMLLNMITRVEMLRGLVFAAAVQVDLADHAPDPQSRAAAASFAQWLLPLVKTFSGETAFEVSSEAIQILGGAGYTRNWPAEQGLRDARIFTIYEGTTGMQALDLLHRRLWRDGGAGLRVFLATARMDAVRCALPEAGHALRCLGLLEDAANRLSRLQATRREAEAGADAFLHLSILAATGWIGLRLGALNSDSPAAERLIAAVRYWLTGLADKAVLAHAEALRGARCLEFLAPIRAR